MPDRTLPRPSQPDAAKRTRRAWAGGFVIGLALGLLVALAVFFIQRDSELSRCGHIGGNDFTCVGDDAPPGNCAPIERRNGVMYWRCQP